MLSFTSATGNLFNRLGKAGLLIKSMRSYQSSQVTNMTDVNVGVVGQLFTESDIEAIVGSNYIAMANAPSSIGGLSQSVSRAIINRMVYRDNPQLGQTLTTLQVSESINEVIRQMKVIGATVLAMPVSSSTILFNQGSVFSGQAQGAVVCSVKRPEDGKVLENSFSENILLSCSNNTNSGNEGFAVTGTQSINFFVFNWPGGSSGKANINAINGSVNNSQGNLLTNSSFETWNTAGTSINNWTITSGASGYGKETGNVYSGTACLKLIGDGSTLFSMEQQFGVTAASKSNLSTNTQYSFAVFLRRDGVVPGTGTLTVDLVDSNGVVLQDANGVNNTFNIDLTQLTTVYAPYSGVFRTSGTLPSTYYLRIRQTAALPSNRVVYIDRASLGQMTQLYTSGPYFSIHSGNLPFSVGDYAQVAITNGRGAGGTLNTWQTLFACLFTEVLTNEILLPSSSTQPTISDNLIG